jgi:hypothetical protein
MRAIWKGYLKCSLATLPTKMYRQIAPIYYTASHYLAISRRRRW